MAEDLILKTKVKGADEAKSELDKLVGANKSFASSAKAVGVALGAMGVAMGVKAVKEAAKFEKAMTNIATLISGDSTEAIKGLENGIKNLMATVPVTGEDLGLAAYDIVSAGISETSDALGVLNASSRLAVAGLGSASEATDLMTSAINAFNLNAEDAEGVANTLFQTVKAGKTTVSDLAQSFGQLAPIAVATGASFVEVQAATAALTTSGLSASIAQNSLRQLFVEMTKEGNKLTGALHDIGVQNIEAEIAANGFVPTLEKLKTEAGLTDAEFKNLFGSVEAQGAALSLTGATGEAYSATMALMAAGAGDLDEAVQKQLATFDAQAQILKNQVNVLFAELGGAILPLVTKELNEFNAMLKMNRDMATVAAPQVQTMSAVMDELGEAVNRTSGLEQEFLEKVQSVTIQALGAYTDMENGREGLALKRFAFQEQEIIKAREWLEANKTALLDAGISYNNFSTEAINAIGMIDIGMAQSISTKKAEAVTLMKEVVSGLDEGRAQLGPMVSMIVGMINQIASAQQSASRSMSSIGGGGKVQHKAKGGFIEPVYAQQGMFVPRGTDTVPAMLTPGELVLNAAQQKNLAGKLGGVNINISGVFGSDAGREIADMVVNELKFASAI